MSYDPIFLTIDAAITIKKQKILLIKRAKEPFLDKYVFPGGHFDVTDVGVKESCARELKEEVGLNIDPNKLQFLTILDGLDRDPRPGRRVTIVFTYDFSSEEELAGCKADTDAKSIHILDISSLNSRNMGFDHIKAVELLK